MLSSDINVATYTLLLPLFLFYETVHFIPIYIWTAWLLDCVYFLSYIFRFLLNWIFVFHLLYSPTSQWIGRFALCSVCVCPFMLSKLNLKWNIFGVKRGLARNKFGEWDTEGTKATRHITYIRQQDSRQDRKKVKEIVSYHVSRV